mgnify:CR=1 FL=1
MLLVGDRLDQRDRAAARARRRTGARSASAACRYSVDRHLAPDASVRAVTSPCSRLEQRKEPASRRRAARRLIVSCGCRAPAERAGHVRCECSARRRCFIACVTLRFEIAQVRDARGRDVRNAVRHRDQRHVLAGPEDVARRSRPDRRRRRGARRGRRRAGALHAGVHVGLVVVADVEHVVVALEHPRQAAEADVGRAAVAALRDRRARRGGLCAACAAATPDATAAALPKSEWIHGICQEVSG